MGKNIILIGFMGTGKSTVGLRLAQKLQMSFIDMDKEIERLTGLSIEEMFRYYGEIRFRSEESLLAKKLGQGQNRVIATGGGIVLQAKNVEVLRENGILICLEAKPENILNRVNHKKGTRPLLKKNTKIEDIVEMLKTREDLYNCADFRISTDDRDVENIVDDIISLLKHPVGESV